MVLSDNGFEAGVYLPDSVETGSVDCEAFEVLSVCQISISTVNGDYSEGSLSWLWFTYLSRLLK